MAARFTAGPSESPPRSTYLKERPRRLFNADRANGDNRDDPLAVALAGQGARRGCDPLRPVRARQRRTYNQPDTPTTSRSLLGASDGETRASSSLHVPRPRPGGRPALPQASGRLNPGRPSIALAGCPCWAPCFGLGYGHHRASACDWRWQCEQQHCGQPRLSEHAGNTSLEESLRMRYRRSGQRDPVRRSRRSWNRTRAQGGRGQEGQRGQRRQAEAEAELPQAGPFGAGRTPAANGFSD